MTEIIVYTHVSKGGGVDGRDHTDKGGVTRAAFFTREGAEKDGNAPWNDVVPVVVDVDKTKKEALAKLTPVERLILKL